MRVSWTARRSNQSIQKEINPEYSLEGLRLKLKLHYLGHLMGRSDSLEKTLMLGKIEGGRRKGKQKMRWLDPRLGFPGSAWEGGVRVGGGELHGHHSAAEPLSSRLPGASVQWADIDPAQPSSIPAACSPLCSCPTKKRRGHTPSAAPAGILSQNKLPGSGALAPA